MQAAFDNTVSIFALLLTGKAPLSGRNRDVKEKTNVNFQTQRIMKQVLSIYAMIVI